MDKSVFYKEATALERWALDARQYYLAMSLRTWRGSIHQFVDENYKEIYEQECQRWRKKVWELVEKFVGNPSKEIIEMMEAHLRDEVDYDETWIELHEYLDRQELHEEHQAKRELARELYLKTLTVNDILKMFPDTKGAWKLRTEYKGRYNYEVQTEYWRFPDGTEVRWDDGLGFAHHIKKYKELI